MSERAKRFTEAYVVWTALAGAAGAFAAVLLHRSVETALACGTLTGLLSAPLCWLSVRPTGRHRASRRLRATAWAMPAVALAIGAVVVIRSAPTTPKPFSDQPPYGFVTLMTDLINHERSKAGCGTLVLDTRLSTAAQVHSTDMARGSDFSHVGSDASSFMQRISRDARRGDISAIGELIGYGFEPRDVIAAWLASPAHKAVLLNCEADALGIGAVRNSARTIYWTTDFARFVVPG
jgi:uncharacterized protein YkwD